MNPSPPPAAYGQSGLETKVAAAGHAMFTDDFLARLDKKLSRRNERLIDKLLAWGELLDAAGWSVALSHAGGDFWLSERAKRDLHRLGGVPETWAELLVVLDGLSEELLYQKGEGVFVWSGHFPMEARSEPDPGVTRRENEVLSWLCEGKTSPEIAIIFGCATRTVEKHLANLYRKLKVKNRAAVILKVSNPID